MAGEISIRVTLTQTLLNEIAAAGLEMVVQVDCSHNAHVQTRRMDRPGQPIIAKPIELDCAVRAITDRTKLATVIGRLQAARPSSPLFQVYQAFFGIAGASGGAAGLSALTLRNLKVEFPNFDATIVNLANPPTTIRNAVMAAQAPTAAAFNALPADLRQSMGMYLRTNALTFALTGAREPQPRVAA
jgi:hypothetical protein